MIRTLLLSAAALALAPAALANDAPAADAADAESFHAPLGTEIIVTAPFQRERFLLSTAAGVLESEALARELRTTLGETLARQPGVSATFFGPNASRPILRGFDAERVRILTDGIGSFDVSNTSPDHAVALNPLRADRIEVVRGPATLLYGSGAIGGVVNITERRLKRELPDGPHADAVGQLASAAKERSIAGEVDLPLGRFVLHADGSYTRTGDYRTGGFIFSRDVRDAAAAIGGEAAEDAQARGRVEGSDARTWEAAAGASYIGERGSLGFSVARLESNYGIPSGLELEEEGEEHEGEEHGDEEHGHSHSGVRLDMRQTRVDARAEAALGGAFETIRLRAGFAEYRHDELEPPEEDGAREIGTSFFSDSAEARLELVQADRDGWRGAIGAQFLHRRFEAVGEEAYIPLNLTDQFGMFTLQSFDLGALRAEIGGRFEHTRVGATSVGVERRFDAYSGSAGLSIPLGAAFRLAGSVGWTERAPAAEELFANGPHAATSTFEIGDPGLAKERALTVEALLRGRGEGWRIELSGFHTSFRDFIYLAATGGEEDGFPVFEYLQQDARYWGLEAEAAVTLARFGDTRVEAFGVADFVRARLNDDAGNVARIPPLRLLGGLEATGGVIGARAEVEHVTRQTRVAAFETETPAFTMVNAAITWRPFGRDSENALIASVNNIFDVEARRHSSFIKDFAPLLGRDARVTVRLGF